MRLVAGCVLFAAAVAVAVPSSAQGTGTSTSKTRSGKPAAPRAPLDIRAFGTFDVNLMDASETFNAVTGSPAIFGFGAGVELRNLIRRLFVRGAFEMSSGSGTNVNVVDGVGISTGIATTLKFQMVEVGAGWRLQPFKKQPTRAVYFGGGFVFGTFSHQSPLGTDDENTRESVKGLLAFGGYEMPLRKNLTIGAEGQWRRMPVTPATNSVLESFSERDLGGIIVRAVVTYKIK